MKITLDLPVKSEASYLLVRRYVECLASHFSEVLDYYKELKDKEFPKVKNDGFFKKSFNFFKKQLKKLRGAEDE